MELAKKALSLVIKVLSEKQSDVRQTYKLQRTLDKMGQFSLLRPLCKTADIEIQCTGHSVPVRLFFPEGEPAGTLLFFHGGGWVTGDVETYERVCAVTARRTGYIVAAVEYRLAPEHKFPCGLEDCYEAARFLFLQSLDILGMGPEKIVLMGDSAGGNLAAAVSLMAAKRGEFHPTRQILLYPATYNDHTSHSPFLSVQENGTGFLLTAARIREYMELYESKPEDRKNPYFAPLLAKEVAGQPDTLVLTAEFDPLRDEGEAYGAKLWLSGCTVEVYRMQGALHGFLSMPAGLSVVKKTYEILRSFLYGEPMKLKEGVEVEIEKEHTLEPVG